MTNNAPKPFPIGTTIVTHTATRGGQSATCTQQVTISDTTAPIMNCADPSLVVQSLVVQSLDQCSFPNIPPVTINDCADTIRFTSNVVSLVPGGVSVQWTATDAQVNYKTQ